MKHIGMKQGMVLVIGILLMAFAGGKIQTKLGFYWELPAFAIGIILIAIASILIVTSNVVSMEKRLRLLELKLEKDQRDLTA